MNFCVDCGKKLTGHGNPKRCNPCAKKGKLNPMFGKKIDKIHKEKIRQALKGKYMGQKNSQFGKIPWNKGKQLPPSWNKGKSSWSKGKHLSIEHRAKIKQANLKTWNSKQKRIEHGLKFKGRFVSLETKIKQSIARKGIYCREMHPNWKGGITPLYEMIRHSEENIKWRNTIFQRDHYTCQDCGCYGGNLEAHHIKPFSFILAEFLIQYSQFSPLEDKETLARLAINYGPFWDVSNGETLCENCHKVKTFGVINA